MNTEKSGHVVPAVGTCTIHQKGLRSSAAIRVHLRSLACVTLLAALCGCGTTAKRADGPAKPDPSAFGKYYADDGPPLVIPSGLDKVPDAQPRDEPFHKFANRPYAVFGETYVPVVNKEKTKQRGMASWYGRKFQGQKTASGEPYDMFAMTAAHKTLPIPSYAKVTNLANGLSVVVRINDRGPFHANRIIDLSYAAAAKIGLAGKGSGMVEVERVFPGESGGREPTTTAQASPSTMALTVPPPAAFVETPVVTPEQAGLWLQLGAFSSAESAEAFRDHAARELTWMFEPLSITQAGGLHRVRLGPYKSREEANAIADKVRQTLGVAPSMTPR
jgi:rare lipoprotein A